MKERSDIYNLSKILNGFRYTGKGSKNSKPTEIFLDKPPIKVEKFQDENQDESDY